jgi:DNA-binding SARP family transcriptional activator
MNRFRLRLLGSFYLTQGEKPATGFRSDKERALLAYLATEALRPHHRDALAGLLWPELPDETAQNNLRVTLHRLRKVLGDHGTSNPVLLITRKPSIESAAQLWLDVSAFEA